MTTCKECRFWDAWYRGATDGKCRKSMPQHILEDRGIWPVTEDDDWCGAAEPRDGVKYPGKENKDAA